MMPADELVAVGELQASDHRALAAGLQRHKRH